MLFSLSLLWSTSQLTVRAEELLSNTLFALIFARTNFRAFSRRIVSSPSLALFPGRVFDNHICRWGHVIGKLAYRFPHGHVVWPSILLRMSVISHVRHTPVRPRGSFSGSNLSALRVCSLPPPHESLHTRFISVQDKFSAYLGPTSLCLTLVIFILANKRWSLHQSDCWECKIYIMQYYFFLKIVP